jgi:hypothetical protein
MAELPGGEQESLFDGLRSGAQVRLNAKKIHNSQAYLFGALRDTPGRSLVKPACCSWLPLGQAKLCWQIRRMRQPDRTAAGVAQRRFFAMNYG